MTEDEFRNGKNKTPKFYIRNKERGYLGNSFMWYAKDGQGYTAYLSGAERFDEDEARAMVKRDGEKWEAYSCEHVDQRCHIVFDSQDVGNLGKPINPESSWTYFDARDVLGGR